MNKELIIKRILIAVFIISILPLIIMGFYARPLWDDYSSITIAKYISDNYSPLLSIFAPIIHVITYYFSWQGTYSAELLFALQPGGWFVPAYWVTTFLMIGSISFAYIYLFRTIVNRVFAVEKSYGTILALMLLIVQFQYVPSIHQAFYWFNGSVYYSFFYALILVELALIVNCIFDADVTKKRVKWISVLIFFISGGNYSTALVNCVILFMLTLAVYFKRKEKFVYLRNMTVVAIVGLFISMIAPGNRVRANTVTSMNPVKAILMSFVEALRLIKGWVELPQIALLICMIPLAIIIVKKTDFKFRYPVIALGIMFGLFSAQLTPPLYAMSYIGDSRQVNMYYYSMYLLMAGCLLYITGWLSTKFPKIVGVIENMTVWLVICGVVIGIIGVYLSNYHTTSFYKTATDIVSGRATQYDKDYDEMIATLEGDNSVCYVKDIEQWTNSLDRMCIDTDPENWLNKGLAEYFGKEKIILQE